MNRKYKYVSLNLVTVTICRQKRRLYVYFFYSGPELILWLNTFDLKIKVIVVSNTFV